MNQKGMLYGEIRGLAMAAASIPNTVCAVHSPGPRERLEYIVDELLLHGMEPKDIIAAVSEHLAAKFVPGVMEE